jgi:hypothetical protein
VSRSNSHAYNPSAERNGVYADAQDFSGQGLGLDMARVHADAQDLRAQGLDLGQGEENGEDEESNSRAESLSKPGSLVLNTINLI